MRNISFAVLVFGGLGAGIANAQDVGASATSLVQSAVDKAKNGSNAPEWLRRTEINVESLDKSKPTWAIETVQPLYQTPKTLQDTYFFQGRWGFRNDDDTINLGLGYRRLLEDKSWLLGVNAFYDTTTKYRHERAGWGAEAMGRYLTLRTNFYNAMSDVKTVSTLNGISTTEKALSGYDFEIDAPMPYLPWLRLAATSYVWKSATSGINDSRGDRLALRGNITPNLSIELGRYDDNYRKSEGYLMVAYNFLGRPNNGVSGSMSQGARSADAFQARDLTLHTLDKVRRQNDIVVERKSGGGAGVTIGRRN